VIDPKAVRRALMVAKNLATKIDPGFAVHKMPEPGIGVPLERAAGGSVNTLLNSMGKPVHHTPEGVENFGQWHKGSKVVDKHGRPLVVYHGTRKNFKNFSLNVDRNTDMPRDAQGFYFSKAPEDASAYASDEFGDTTTGSNVMPVYLSMKNPFVVKLGDIDNHPAYISDEKRRSLEQAGYDGIDYGDGREYVVFRPDQIKSAVGNAGTFASGDPDITKAAGGAIKTIEGPQREQNLAEFMRGVHHELFERNGKPKRLYHGRTGDYSVFRGDLTGSRHRDLEVGDAFHFTDDTKTADWYAKSAGRQTKGGANVMPVHLRMVNPLVVNYDGAGAEYLDEDVEQAKQLGHDGVIAKNIDDGRVSDHFIVFHPLQIKSAIGNIGTFDPEDPDITKAAGGAIKPVMGRKREQNLAEFMRDAHPIAFDEKGKPRRFYHGTAVSGIYKFQGHRGSAGHFAFHPEVASDFAQSAHENEQETLARGEEDLGDGGQVYAVHLNVKNPFDVENPEHREKLNMPHGFWDNHQFRDYELLEDLSARIRKSGFDSYIDYEHPGEKTGIAVFEPHQIKSAVGNIGTFDPEDPDITKAEGGEVEGQVAYPEEGAARMQQQLPMMRNLQPLGITREAGDQSQFIGTPAIVSSFIKSGGSPEHGVAYTPPVLKWVGNTVAKYIRRDMGAEHDPLRKLADEEGLLHAPMAHYNMLKVTRNLDPVEGRKQLAETPAGKMWENFADRSLSVMNKNEARLSHPDQSWLEKAPEEGKYISQEQAFSDRAFQPLFETLDAAVHPDNPLDLPEQFRLRPESFDRLPMAQAVKLANQIWEWRKNEKSRPNLKRAFDNPAVKSVYEYPHSDLAWYEIGPSGTVIYKDPENPSYRDASDPYLEKALKYEGDVMGHCVGGYGRGILQRHLKGDSEKQQRVYSLRNKKTGEPHVTIDAEEAVTDQTVPSSLHPDGRWRTAKMNLNQIRGKSDDQPASRYLPYVRDFVTQERAGNPIREAIEQHAAGLKYGSRLGGVRFIHAPRNANLVVDEQGEFQDPDDFDYDDYEDEDMPSEEDRQKKNAELRRKDEAAQSLFDKKFRAKLSPEEVQALVTRETPKFDRDRLEKQRAKVIELNKSFKEKMDTPREEVEGLKNAAIEYLSHRGMGFEPNEREQRYEQAAKEFMREAVDQDVQRVNDRNYEGLAPFFTPAMLKASAYGRILNSMNTSMMRDIHDEHKERLSKLRDEELAKIPEELNKMREFVDPGYVKLAQANQQMLDKIFNEANRMWRSTTTRSASIKDAQKVQRKVLIGEFRERFFSDPDLSYRLLNSMADRFGGSREGRYRGQPDPHFDDALKVVDSLSEYLSRNMSRVKRASGGKATALPLAEVRVPNSDNKAVRKALMIAKSRRQ
jgi:hypothetical protein